MSVKLFTLGYPGSGKSTAYRCIQAYIERNLFDWSTIRFCDYDILQVMFQYEKLYAKKNKDRQFRETAHGGFDVLDFSVLDTALRDLEKQVRQRYIPSSNELIVIEFARDDYKQALKQFSPNFLKDAYFLSIEADIQTCIERVKKRVMLPQSSDDHFVSEDILIKYYGRRSAPINFKTDLHVEIDKKRVKTINSRGSLEAFNTKVEQYIEPIIARENLFPPPQAKIPRPKVLTRLLAYTYR